MNGESALPSPAFCSFNKYPNLGNLQAAESYLVLSSRGQEVQDTTLASAVLGSTMMEAEDP